MTLIERLTQPIQQFMAASNKTLQRTLTRQQSKPSETYNWLNSIYGTKYNPDPKSYVDYQKMMEDPQIKGSLNLIYNALLQKKHIITPASDSPEDEEIALFVEETLENLTIPLRKVRRDLYTAIPYGYAVSEIVYKYDETSDKITYDKIVSIDISTLEDCFKLDEYGNVTDVIQELNNSGSNPIPVEKCLIYSFDSEFNNPYGESSLKSLYDTWYIKKKILKWWAIYLQKHESPTMYGKVGVSGDGNKLLEGLEGVREGRQQFTIGSEDEVGVLESTHRGEGFERAIAYHDMIIHRRLGIGTLLLGQQESSGSYAQSQTHDSTFKLMMDGIHEDLSAMFQQKIQELVDYNYDVEVYPNFSFEPLTEKDIIGLLNALKPLVDNFVINADDPNLHELIDTAIEQYGGIKIQEEDEEQKQENNKPQPQSVEEVIQNTEDNKAVEPSQNVVQRVQEVLPTPSNK